MTAPIPTPFMFESDDARHIMAYVQERHGDFLEFLWVRFPKYAILRRQDTGKWYAALMVITAKQIGLPGDTEMEVVNVRAEPETVIRLLESGKGYPAYHMTKHNWITIPLDGRFTKSALTRLIDNSYTRAVK